jgi:hypothetical protein
MEEQVQTSSSDEQLADQEAAKTYRTHPLALALARDRYCLERRPRPPVPRGHCGHFLKGHSGNPSGRPRGRPKMREAFHKLGLDAAIKLAALTDNPMLSFAERVELYMQCIRLSYSVRAIRSDASAKRRLAQQQREAEMDAAVRHFFERANIPPAMLARMQAAASSGTLFGAKARAPYGAPAAGGDPTPPSVEVPTDSEARAPSSAATPGGEPAPPSEAKAHPVGEAQDAPEGDGEARPGDAPRRPFRISLPA